MMKLAAKHTASPKLKATQAELEEAQAELEASQAELAALQSKLEASQIKQDALQSKLNAAQDELQMLQSTQAELATTHAKLQLLQDTQAELAASRTELQLLQDAQAELVATQAELQTTRLELENSQKQVLQLKKVLKKLKKLQAKDTIDLHNPSPSDQALRFPAWILLPMRIFLGLTFIYAGIQKLTDPQFFNPAMSGYIANQIKGMAHGSPLHAFLIDVALPHAVLFGWMTALGEIAIGIGTYAGLLFRPAAFFGLILSLTFFLSASWNTYPYFFGSDIVFIFCWLTMLLGGPLNTGLASLDDWIVEQIMPEGHARHKLSAMLQLYILLVVAGTPHKSSYTADIGLWKINPLARSSPAGQHYQPSSTQTAEMTRRGVMKDWAVGAATVASITLLGIPLRIFGHDPNAGFTDTTVSAPNTTAIISPADTASPTSVPNTPTPTAAPSPTSVPNTPTPTAAPSPTKAPVTLSPPRTTSTPKIASVPPSTSAAPPMPVRPVTVGQSIAPVTAIPINSAVKFVLASSQDDAVLIHLPDNTFVAFDAVCTHAGCTVKYQPSNHLLACPCHGSLFDPMRNGRVLQGPAIAPLTPLSIQIDSAGAINLKSVPS